MVTQGVEKRQSQTFMLGKFFMMSQTKFEMFSNASFLVHFKKNMNNYICLWGIDNYQYNLKL